MSFIEIINQAVGSKISQKEVGGSQLKYIKVVLDEGIAMEWIQKIIL